MPIPAKLSTCMDATMEHTIRTHYELPVQALPAHCQSSTLLQTKLSSLLPTFTASTACRVRPEQALAEKAAYVDAGNTPVQGNARDT